MGERERERETDITEREMEREKSPLLYKGGKHDPRQESILLATMEFVRIEKEQWKWRGKCE